MTILIFTVGQAKFGIDIKYTKEIMQKKEITKSITPSFSVVGMVNIRDKVYTCIDMHKLLFKEEPKNEPHLMFLTENNDNNIAYLINSIDTVVDIDQNDIQEPSPLLKNGSNNYIQGLIYHNEDIITLLDLEKLNIEI